MNKLNEQFEKYATFQAEAFAPFRAFGDVAAETFEKLARENYQVLGDYVDFAVNQAQLPANAKDFNEYIGKQIDVNRAFGEKLAARAEEYAAIVRRAQDRAQEVTVEVQEKAVKAQEKATKKAA